MHMYGLCEKKKPKSLHEVQAQSVCVCVCVCACMWVCLTQCVHRCVHPCTCMFCETVCKIRTQCHCKWYALAFVPATHLYICTRKHAHETCTHKYAHATRHTHTHTHTHMRLCSHTVFTKHTCVQCMNVHTCIVMYIACAPSSSHTHKHTHTQTHTHKHTQTGLVPHAVTLGFYFSHCFHKAYMCMNVHTCIVM